MQSGNCLEEQDFVYVGQLLHVPNAFALGLATDPQAASVSILFVRDEGTFRNLWGVRSNGVAPQRLTANMLINGPPIRSSDLTQVALRGVSSFHVPTNPSQANLAELPSDLWLVATDGAGLRLVVDQGPTDTIYRSLPAWSPDGTLLAFTEQRDAIGSLVIIQPNSRNRQVVYTADFTPPNHKTPITPAWSPDGTELAIVAWEAPNIATLYTVPPQARALPTTQYGAFLYIAGPYWVPLNGLNGRPALGVQTLDRRFRPQWQVVDTARGTIDIRRGGLRLVNRTVEWLAYSQDDKLHIVDINGVGVTVLPTDFTGVSFAPDGNQIVAGLDDEGMSYLRLDEPLQQTILGGSVLYPVWSPPEYIVLP